MMTPSIPNSTSSVKPTPDQAAQLRRAGCKLYRADDGLTEIERLCPGCGEIKIVAPPTPEALASVIAVYSRPDYLCADCRERLESAATERSRAAARAGLYPFAAGSTGGRGSGRRPTGHRVTIPKPKRSPLDKLWARYRKALRAGNLNLVARLEAQLRLMGALQ